MLPPTPHHVDQIAFEGSSCGIYRILAFCAMQRYRMPSLIEGRLLHAKDRLRNQLTCCGSAKRIESLFLVSWKLFAKQIGHAIAM